MMECKTDLFGIKLDKIFLKQYLILDTKGKMISRRMLRLYSRTVKFLMKTTPLSENVGKIWRTFSRDVGQTSQPDLCQHCLTTSDKLTIEAAGTCDLNWQDVLWNESKLLFYGPVSKQIFFWPFHVVLRCFESEQQCNGNESTK